jgi:hypothetical protein
MMAFSCNIGNKDWLSTSQALLDVRLIKNNFTVCKLESFGKITKGVYSRKRLLGKISSYRVLFLHGSHSYRLNIEIIHNQSTLTKETPYHSKISLADNFVADRLLPRAFPKGTLLFFWQYLLPRLYLLLLKI